MSTASSVKFTCRTPTCNSYCVMASDSPLPKDWECPACQSHTEEQMLDDLERRHRARQQQDAAMLEQMRKDF